jgi:cyclopropane fatty-acyl-phospholipid synthase-like methyltransferase
MNTSEYAFTDRGHEQRRLASQAEEFDPLTERVFRAAGLVPGMRVLDLGSGAASHHLSFVVSTALIASSIQREASSNAPSSA